MATADEIQNEIDQLQNEKDVLDAKIDKLADMLTEIDWHEYTIFQVEDFIAEDCNMILKIYNQFGAKEIDNSIGYIEDLYLNKIKSERKKFDTINKELIDNIVLVRDKIKEARDLYDGWVQDSKDLGNQISSLKWDLFFANLLGG